MEVVKALGDHLFLMLDIRGRILFDKVGAQAQAYFSRMATFSGMEQQVKRLGRIKGSQGHKPRSDSRVRSRQ